MNEAIVGYDSIANPARAHRVWKLLRASKPHGVTLTPEHWGVDGQFTARELGLPAAVISLVLQYKRPQIVRAGSRSPQHVLWGDEDYFRIALSIGQQRTLTRLERALGKSALVRYCAPAFHTFDELYDRMKARQTLKFSSTVSPTAPDGETHKYWTFQAADTTGKWNPDGIEHFSNSLQSIISVNTDNAPSLSEHLGDFARSYLVPSQMGVAALTSWVDAVDEVLPGYTAYAVESGVPYLRRDFRELEGRRAIELMGAETQAEHAKNPLFETVRNCMLSTVLANQLDADGLRWYWVAPTQAT